MIARGGRRRRRPRRRIVRDIGGQQPHVDEIAVRQLDEGVLRDQRVRELGIRIGIRIVGELQREDLVDDILRFRRQIGRRQEADDALAVDGGLRSGLVDGGDRRQRALVEQHGRAAGAVGLEQHLESDGRRIGLDLHLEIDLDQHRGAADAHGCDRRIDLHVAMLGGGARDKGDGALHEAEQRRVARPVGVVDHLVQHHLRVRAEAEHAAVDKGDAERGGGSGLDDVALIDVVAEVENDRNAIADDGGISRQLGDVADHLGRGGAAIGLRELGMTGERVDDVAGEMGAIGRRQRGALLAPEVIRNDQLVVVLRDHEIETGPLEVAVEQQMRVLDDDRTRRCMGRYRLYMHLPLRVHTVPRKRQTSIEFTDKIQGTRPARKVNF